MNNYWNFVEGKIVDTDIEEIIKKIKSGDNEAIFLTASELRKLEKNLNVIDKERLRRCSIFLYLNYPTELSYKEYKKLHTKYKFSHLFVQGFSKMKFDEDYNNSSDIDPNIMMIYLKKLNELTQDLPTNSSSIESSIKTLCILSNRIIENVFYDINTTWDGQPEKNKSRYSVPNEIIGILDQKCVCRGYAGIFRDACKILGYDVININGRNPQNGEGHEWNQVKLGDDWYNCDLTFDRYCILHKMTPLFLLSSDTEFYRDDYITDTGAIVTSHSSYLNETNLKRHKADKTISRDLIYTFLYEEDKKKKDWLKVLIQKVKNTYIDKGDEAR